MIRNEFGQSGALSLSKYYRGRGLVPNSPKNYSISTGGRIAHSMFRGASKELSAQEVTQTAWDSRQTFSRFAPAASNTPWPDGWYRNDAWARETNPVNIGYWFYNDGFQEVDDWCTIVISHSSPNPSTSISSIMDINGNGIGYSNVNSVKSVRASNGDVFFGDGGLTHTMVYHVNVDRRRIRNVHVYTATGPSRNNCQQESCLILPGRQTVINQFQHNGAASFFIRHGDVIHTAQTKSWEHWGDMINHPYRLSAGIVWYNGNASSIMYGLDDRWYSLDAGGSAANILGISVRLRKLQAGQVATSYDDLSNSLTRGTVNQGYYSEGNYTFGSDSLVYTASFPNEILTVIGFSVTSSNVPGNDVTYSNGAGVRIYPNFNNSAVRQWIGYSYQTQGVALSMSGTMTVRTASGRTMSVNWSLNGNAWSTYYQEQTGGD